MPRVVFNRVDKSTITAIWSPSVPVRDARRPGKTVRRKLNIFAR